MDKFQIHVFLSSIVLNKKFNLQYTDYPKYIVASMNYEQLYKQSVTNFENKAAGVYNLQFQESAEQNG